MFSLGLASPSTGVRRVHPLLIRISASRAPRSFLFRMKVEQFLLLFWLFIFVVVVVSVFCFYFEWKRS